MAEEFSNQNSSSSQTVSGNGASSAPMKRKAGLDWLILPLISLCTIFLLICSTRLAAKMIFHGSTGFTCLGAHSLVTGAYAEPNSVCKAKEYETQWIEYRFNSCGHRSAGECGTKPPGVYRIVLIGSSLPMGANVQSKDSFAVLVPPKVSSLTGKRVEIYDEGMATVHPPQIPARIQEALEQKPDLIVWAVLPTDIERAVPPIRENIPQDSGVAGVALFRLRNDLREGNLHKTIDDLWSRTLIRFNHSPSAVLLQHVLYQSRNQYIKSLMAGGDANGYLSASLDPQWQNRLQYFDHEFASVASTAKKANVPVALVLVPSRGQATLLSRGHWDREFDPYVLDRSLHEIVTRNGGIYLDILPYYASVPYAENGYYPVDGHPNATGHSVIAEALTQQLTGGAVPALDTSKTASEKGN